MTTNYEFTYHSYYGSEGADGPVQKRIAELAELVSSDCAPPLESSYVRELLKALVNSIRGRAETGWRPSPREPEGRPGNGPAADEPTVLCEAEPRCAERATPASVSGKDSRKDSRKELAAASPVVGFDDARRVLEELHNERIRGGGPLEDLQRALL